MKQIIITLILITMMITVVSANVVVIPIENGQTATLDCGNYYVCYNPSTTYTSTSLSQLTCGETTGFCDNLLNNRCTINVSGTFCCNDAGFTVSECNKKVDYLSIILIIGAIVVVILFLLLIFMGVKKKRRKR